MSPAVLYRQLPGEGLDAFIAEFQKTAASDPLGTVFIVPTSHLAREIVHRLGREGVSVISNMITTLPGFARKVFEDSAGSEELISGAESRLIIDRLLARGNYPLIDRAGAVDELATLFEVLITRKIDYPAALGDLESDKSTEIGCLFAAYLQFLDDHRLVDESTLLARAARTIPGSQDFRTVYVYGLYEPMPLERDLLLALRNVAEEFHCMIPYAANPAIFVDDGGWLQPDAVVAGEWLPGVAAIFSGRETGDGGEIIWLAGRRDRLEEVRGIAQEIRDLTATGVRPGEISVAFPDLASAIPYVEEVFPDFGVPYTTSGGRPLSESQLVQALLSVLAVPARDYRREDVIALVTTPYLPFSPGSRIDILSREARITAGTDTWDSRLAALIPNGGATGPEVSKTAAITAVREQIRALFADLAALEGRKTLADHITAYRSLLRGWRAPVMPAEGEPGVREGEVRDLRRFTDALAELEGLTRFFPEEKMPLSGFHSLLGSFIGGIRTGRRRGGNAVRVIGVREAAHLAIPYLFIGDLIEGKMPRLTTRLPFATDLETRRLRTRSKNEILREERYHFTAALLAARSRVYLSYPSADGDVPLVRSGFVDAVREAFSPEPWGNDDFPDSRLITARKAGALLARGAVAYPSALTAREAVRRLNIENYHRKGVYDFPYDGLIGSDPAITGRFGEDAVFSVTALETYADCPFRFYMERVLNLIPLPPADPILTGEERGSLVHRTVFRFYTGWRRDGNTTITVASYPDALQRILEIGREEADRFTFAGPAWIAAREHLLGSPAAGPGLLERFLQHEITAADSSGFIPEAFEVSFGLPVISGEGDPASVPDAVEIALGGRTLRLRGRIDRIDHLPGGQFVVTDYKTGRRRPTLRDVVAGRELQLPLYIRAVEILTGMEGVAGTCYTLRRGEVRNVPVFCDADLRGCFPGSRQGGVGDVRELIETSLARVEEYLAGMQNGHFPPRSDAGPCPGYCNFRTICRFDGLRLLAAHEEVNTDETD